MPLIAREVAICSLRSLDADSNLGAVRQHAGHINITEIFPNACSSGQKFYAFWCCIIEVFYFLHSLELCEQMCSAKTLCYMVLSLITDIAEADDLLWLHMGNHSGLSCL